MKTKPTLLLTFATLLLITACKKKDDRAGVITSSPPAVPPTVYSAAIVSIDLTDSSVVAGGTVSATGGNNLSDRGVCWDTLPAPTTLKQHIRQGTSTGKFTCSIQGLLPGKTYHVRAYATNGVGTAYGQEMIVKLPVPRQWEVVSNSAGLTCMIGSGANFYAGSNSGVRFSSDTGNTWINIGLTGYYVYKVVQLNGSLFAIANLTAQNSNRDLFRSTDNGVTWTSLGFQLPYLVQVWDMAVANNKLAIGTDSSVFISPDNGQTWSAASNGLTPGYVSGVYGRVSALYTNNNGLYAFSYMPTGAIHLFHYRDAGNQWVDAGYPASYNSPNSGAGSGNNFAISNYDGVFISINGGSFNRLDNLQGTSNMLSGSGNNIICSNEYAYGSSPLYISRDSGVTWTNIGAGQFYASSLSGFVSEHAVWVFSSYYGIYRYRLTF